MADFHQRPYGPTARCAIDQHGIAVGMPVSHGVSVNQRNHDWRAERALRDYHRGWRKQDTEGAKRARAREKQIDRQSDYHGRQTKQGIGKHDQRASSAKAVYRERRSKRPTDHRGA